MKKSHGRNLVKIILIASIGIFLSSAYAVAATPEQVLRQAKEKNNLRLNRTPARINFNLTPTRTSGLNLKTWRSPDHLNINTRFYSFRTAQIPRISSSALRINAVIPRTTRINSVIEAQSKMVYAAKNRLTTPARVTNVVPRITSLASPRIRPINLPAANTITRSARLPRTAILPATNLKITRNRINNTNTVRNTLRNIPAIAARTTTPVTRITTLNPRLTTLNNQRPAASVTNLNNQRTSRVTIPNNRQASFNSRRINNTTARLNTPVPRVATPNRVAIANPTRNNLRRATLKPPTISSAPARIKPLQSMNTRFKTPTIIRSVKGLNLSPRQPLYARLPKGSPVAPLPASTHREPVGLPATPVVPANAPSQAGGSNAGAGGSSGNHASSGNHSSGAGIPLAAPLILGLCGHLPASNKKALSRIISEISRRQKNGIGFMLAPRSPTIIQMGESSLAFVHQIKRENQAVNPIFFQGLFVLSQVIRSEDRFLRSQDDCGLFYFLRVKNGR